jgi:hypothetical protein
MGLKGGDTGCKAVFQTQFPDSFMACPRLDDVRQLVGVDRSETLAVLDGNVMVMAVPQSMTTFHQYVQILVAQITPVVEAAAHIVVVFDEPKAMTRAKQAEQRDRDAKRTSKTPVCSDELMACITTDEFTEEMLHADGCNVRMLMDHRKARPRFFDALCVAVRDHFLENTSGAEWSLTFDGIDARGANRAFDASRVAGVVSTDDAFWAPLLARETAIGEGDIKLTDVSQRVHDDAKREASPVHGVVLNLLVTVDTDSLAIELLKQQTRLQRVDATDRNELTILCLKEPARKRKGDDFVTASRFLCCNAARFYNDVVAYLVPECERDGPAAIALMVAALACCGCDFLRVEGTRADLMLPVVKEVVRTRPSVLHDMKSIFETDDGSVRKAKAAVDAVLTQYAKEIATKPRMARSHASASNYCDAQVLRALWVVSYWRGREFRDCAAWGFASESVA